MIKTRLYFLLIFSFSFSNLMLSQVDLEEGLVLYLPFDSLAQDESGLNNEIVNNGATLVEGFNGIENGGFRFDGVDDNMVITHSDDLEFNTTENFAISIWFKAESNENTGDLISKWPSTHLDTAYSYAIRILSANSSNPGQISSARYDSDDLFCNGGTIVNSVDGYMDDLWHHVVYQLNDDGMLELYIDNSLVSSNTDNSICSLLSGSNIIIGSRSNYVEGSRKPYKGDLDEIRIYNRTLSQEEIAALFDFTVSTYEVEIPIDLQVYPNPVASKIIISNQSGYQIRENVIFDLSGKMLLKFTSSEKELDLQNGIYFLMTEFENGIKTSNSFTVQK